MGSPSCGRAAIPTRGPCGGRGGDFWHHRVACSTGLSQPSSTTRCDRELAVLRRAFGAPLVLARRPSVGAHARERAARRTAIPTAAGTHRAHDEGHPTEPADQAREPRLGVRSVLTVSTHGRRSNRVGVAAKRTSEDHAMSSRRPSPVPAHASRGGGLRRTSRSPSIVGCVLRVAASRGRCADGTGDSAEGRDLLAARFRLRCRRPPTPLRAVQPRARPLHSSSFDASVA